MALVKEYMDGNCKVRIFDDCVVKTQEEVDAILDTIAEIYYNSFMKQALKAEEEKKAAQQ